MLFSAVLYWEAERQQIFWVIINISVFAAGFRLAKEKHHLLLPNLTQVLSNPETGNSCPRSVFLVYLVIGPKTSIAICF